MRVRLGKIGEGRVRLVVVAGHGRRGFKIAFAEKQLFDNRIGMERTTAVDLVCEATGIPGFAVIATARRAFAV